MTYHQEKHHARAASLVIALKYLFAGDNMFERIRLRFAMPKFSV